MQPLLVKTARASRNPMRAPPAYSKGFHHRRACTARVFVIAQRRVARHTRRIGMIAGMRRWVFSAPPRRSCPLRSRHAARRSRPQDVLLCYTGAGGWAGGRAGGVRACACACALPLTLLHLPSMLRYCGCRRAWRAGPRRRTASPAYACACACALPLTMLCHLIMLRCCFALHLRCCRTPSVGLRLHSEEQNAITPRLRMR